MKQCISDEIADALRGELEGGRYRAGECLPLVDELRRRFGAGEFAVRAALHKLRETFRDCPRAVTILVVKR